MPRDIFADAEAASPRDIFADAPKPEKDKYRAETQSVFNNSFVTGVKEGAEPMAELVGGFGDLLNRGMRAAGITTRDTSKPLPDNVTLPGQMMLPGTVREDSYAPKEWTGKMARTIGQFASNAPVGPEGLLAKSVSTVVPAVGSELGRMATEGTGAEPYGQFVGALLGSMGTGAATRGLQKGLNALEMGAPVATESAVDAAAGTMKDLKGSAGDIYDQVFKDPALNVVISKNALKRLRDRVIDVTAEFGYKPAVNKKAKVLVNEMLGVGKNNATLVDVLLNRRLAGNIAKDYQTSDGALAAKLKKEIGDFISDLEPGDVVKTVEGGGDAVNLSGISKLKEADRNWSRWRKSQLIEKIIEDADITGSVNYTQAGADTALRRGFGALAKNEKKMRLFNPDEQDAIKLAAKGSLGANTMRFLGKFAVRGPVSGAAATAIGHVLGGPAGPYVLAGIGEAAKAGSASATRNNVNALSALVRGGEGGLAKLKAQKSAAMLRALLNYGPSASALTQEQLRKIGPEALLPTPQPQAADIFQ